MGLSSVPKRAPGQVVFLIAPMTVDELFRSGRPEDALASLQQSVRATPGDPKLRVALFQLLSVLGQWERAVNALEALAQLDTSSLLLARMYQPVLRAELLREEVFAGRRGPLLFGESEPWINSLVQANELVARSDFAAAEVLREQAFEAAPATPGKINGSPFAWLMDADSRLGPVLEVIMEGRYLWMPFCRIHHLRLPAPSAWRDLVWAPASFRWRDGSEASGHIPVRYPGTQTGSDGQAKLARRTDWIEKPNGFSLGLGQRLLTTDQEDYPLLETREIELAAT